MKKINQLIKKSETLFALDIRYFSKNSFFLILRQAIIGLFGFALTFVLARQFSKYTFGEYNLVLSLLAMLSIFSLPGMMDSILNSIVHGFDKSFIEGTKLRFKSSFLSIPVILALAYFYNQQSTVVFLLLLSLPFFPFFYSFKTYNIFLIAKEKFFKLFLVSLIASIVTASVAIITTLVFKKIYLTFLSFILTTSLLDLIFYSYIKGKIKKKTKADPGMRKFGLFITLLRGFSQIVNNFDKIILGFFSGLSALALFSIANILPAFIEKTLSSFQGIMVSKIIKAGKKGNQEIIKRHLIKIIFLSILVFFVIYFATPFFIQIFFGTKYKGATRFSQLLSVQLVFSLANSMLGSMVTFQKRRKSMIFFTFYPALPKMALYLLLIPRFGIWGLVVSLVASRILDFIGLLWVSLKND